MKIILLKIMRLNLITILLFLFNGCFTLKTRGPTAIVDSPEVASSDKWRFGMEEKIVSTASICLISDVSARPPSVCTPYLERSYSILGTSTPYTLVSMFKVSTPSPTEFGFGVDPDAFSSLGGSFGTILFGKYQLLGPTYDQKIINSHLLAITSHLSYYSQSLSGEQNGLFGPGGYPYNAKSHFSGFDLGLSYGYRTSKWQLFYLGSSFQIFNVDAEVNQSKASNGDPGGIYKIPASSGTSSKHVLGTVLGKDVFKFDFQVGFSEIFWNTQRLGEGIFGMNFIIQFSPNRTNDLEY